MIISVKAPSEPIADGFQKFAIERITKTLARLAHRVTSVDVRLTDENGPRGGIDKQCRVSVAASGLGLVTTSAKHENPRVAVRLATDRARRTLLTKLKRPTALRVRRHKNAREHSASHSDAALQV